MWLLEAAIVPLFLGALVAYAGAEPYGQFTSGVKLVEVYATVTDRQGEPIAGLTAADFRIVEDGAGQTISAFAAGAFPLSMAIGVDRSFSMGGRDNRLGVAKSAAVKPTTGTPWRSVTVAYTSTMFTLAVNCP